MGGVGIQMDIRFSDYLEVLIHKILGLELIFCSDLLTGLGLKLNLGSD